MSGLAYICGYGYGSNSDEDEEYYVPVDRQRQKLPAPDLSKVSVVTKEEHSDDPTLHGGRTRAFPHERGIWATFIFIKYPEEDDLLKLVAKLQLAVVSVDSCQRTEDFHVSLSKTLVLTYHLISPLTTALQTALGNLTNFDLSFDSVKIFCNEDKTRTFIALKADLFSSSYLQEITQKIDQVLEEYKLPTFYDNPSFHMSILWVNGDKQHELCMILPQLNDIVSQEIGKILVPVSINQILCKSGNKYFQYSLG